MQVKRWARRANHHLSDSPKKHYSGFLNFYEKHLPELQIDGLTNERNSNHYYRTDVSWNGGGVTGQTQAGSGVVTGQVLACRGSNRTYTSKDRRLQGK